MNTQTELFDRYLFGEMTEAECADFEKRLASEPQLMQDWTLHQQVAESLHRHLKKNQIGFIGQGALQRWTWQHRLLYGACALLLLAALASGIWSWENQYKQEKSTPSAPATEISQDSLPIIKPGEVVPKERDKFALNKSIQDSIKAYFALDYPKNRPMGDHPRDSLFALAREAFDEGNWGRSISLYNAIPGLNNYSNHYDRLGAAYLQNGQASEAIQVFRHIAQKPLANMRQKAAWYMLLSLLANKDVAGFDTALTEALKEKNSPYYKRFVALKQAFRPNW